MFKPRKKLICAIKWNAVAMILEQTCWKVSSSLSHSLCITFENNFPAFRFLSHSTHHHEGRSYGQARVCQRDFIAYEAAKENFSVSFKQTDERDEKNSHSTSLLVKFIKNLKSFVCWTRFARGLLNENSFFLQSRETRKTLNYSCWIVWFAYVLLFVWLLRWAYPETFSLGMKMNEIEVQSWQFRFSLLRIIRLLLLNVHLVFFVSALHQRKNTMDFDKRLIWFHLDLHPRVSPIERRSA